MANILSLHQRRVFLPSGDDARYAKLYVSASGTNTAVDTFADEALSVQQSRPVLANAYGVFPAVYVAAGEALRILITDENDVNLPSYPQDNIVPLSADVQGAADVTFSPTEDLPFTNVQDAVVGAGALSTDQSATFARSLTPWLTGGSGNAYTITPSPAITSYGTYQAFVIRPNRTNTGAATLNVNGLGVRDLVVVGNTGANRALVAGEIQIGKEFMAYFDGTRFYTTLGRGHATVVQAFLDSTTKAGMRAASDSIIGTHVQSYTANTQAFGALTGAEGKFPFFTDAETMAVANLTLPARQLLDDLSHAAMRGTLGVTAATGPYRPVGGSAAAPAYSSSIDPNSGVWVAGNGDWRWSINGVDVLAVSSGITVNAALSVTGSLTGSGGGVRGQTAGSIGTTATCQYDGTLGNLSFGDSVAGSKLRPSNAGASATGSPLTGTWQCRGETTSVAGPNTTCEFYRVS